MAGRRVKVSHDKLSQFRVEHLEVLQQVFTEVLAVLLQQVLVSLQAAREAKARDYKARVDAALVAPPLRLLLALSPGE